MFYDTGGVFIGTCAVLGGLVFGLLVLFFAIRVHTHVSQWIVYGLVFLAILRMGQWLWNFQMSTSFFEVSTRPVMNGNEGFVEMNYYLLELLFSFGLLAVLYGLCLEVRKKAR